MFNAWEEKGLLCYVMARMCWDQDKLLSMITPRILQERECVYVRYSVECLCNGCPLYGCMACIFSSEFKTNRSVWSNFPLKRNVFKLMPWSSICRYLYLLGSYLLPVLITFAWLAALGIATHILVYDRQDGQEEVLLMQIKCFYQESSLHVSVRWPDVPL